MNKDNPLQPNRNNNIGTLHLLAAIFVMLGHQFALLNCPNISILGTQIQIIGIRTIFLLSGYLITKSAWSLKGNKGKCAFIYFFKRLGRIYPELIICLLVTAFVIGPLFTELSFSEYFQNIQAVFYYVTSNLKLYISLLVVALTYITYVNT